MKLREDPLIHDFIVDYVRYRRTRKEHEEARSCLLGKLPQYMRQIRYQAHRMTQDELANVLGVDHSYISKLESGSMVPSGGFLEKLEKFASDWEQ